MSRLIHLLARLYPRSWRERYGAEYAALLEDVRPDGRTAANVFIGALAMQIRNWKSWGILAASALFGAAIIASLFVAMPKTYASTAILKVGGQAGPSLSHDTMDAVNTILINVESRQGMTNLIVADGLYQHERSRMLLMDVLDEMIKHIRVTPVDSRAAIAIEFDYSDPKMAQKVTQDLIARFMNENVRQGNGVTLQIIDSASLPQTPIRPNKPVIIGLGVACFLLMWFALSLMRRVSIRRHERAGSSDAHPRTWTDWRILAVSTVVGAAVMVGGFFAIPNFYRSTAVLKAEGQGSPNDKMDALNTLLLHVESRAKLTEIITANGLYPRERSKMTLDDVIQRMVKRISVTPMGRNPAAIRINFDSDDRFVAQRVTADLASRFLDESRQSQGVSLQVLDPASLPYTSLRSDLGIVGLGLTCFLLMWSALSVSRSISARRHA
jgi:capsular polysaccharide biosynthesis protein